MKRLCYFDQYIIITIGLTIGITLQVVGLVLRHLGL